MGRSTFWDRVGDLFRREPLAHPSQDGQAGVPAPTGSAAPERTGWLTRLRRRDSSVAQMRIGYQRMLELMDAMEEHYRRQDERGAQFAEQFGALQGDLGRLAESGRDQQSHIGAIAETVHRAGQHTAAMSTAIAQIPQLLQTEAEAVRSMARQVEITQEAHTQLMYSLQKLGQAVEALNSSSSAQVQTLERLHSEQRDQRSELSALARQQWHRFVAVTVVAGVVVLASLSVLVIVLLRHAA